MNRNAVRIVLLLGIFSIIGILSVQFYFVRKAFDQEDRHMDQTISIALRSVADHLASYTNIELPRDNPVFRHSPSYYIVNINTDVDPDILEQFLISEFVTRGLDLDFEYGIYDCRSDRMVYGRLVRFGENPRLKPLGAELPKHTDFLYYFGINFPGRTQTLVNSLGIWYFFTFILILVIVFFVYSQGIILRQRRYTEIQRDFINTMTHEFKTPLASLLLSADVIQSNNIVNEPERLKKYGRIIKEQVSHLLKQVEVVLESSGLSERGIKLETGDLDIKSLINEIVDQLNPRFCSTGALVNLELDNEVNMIKADRFHLTNILFNLLDNALKYTNGKPVIHIGLKRKVNNIVLTVSDQGIGIPPAYLKRIFDRFYRVPTGNVHNVKGFGLGLYYVKGAVRSHGWKISIHSVENKGTQVDIQIPAR